MIKSILVALDGSDSSVTASKMALQLGCQFGAHVEGLGIVNSAHIQRPEPVPIGGMAQKTSRDRSRLEAARERMECALENFGKQVAAEGVRSHSSQSAEGDPLQLIAQHATAHDLVVIGRRSIFDVEGELYELPLSVEKIVREEPRPILLVPAEWDKSPVAAGNGPVLVAFDGSAAASRALHTFALLGLAQNRSIYVVSVADKNDVATALAQRASALLERHGASQTRAIGLGDDEAGMPSETILGLTKSFGAEMVVMGAYGRRGIREIFGSTTRNVISACPTVLFLHH